MAWPKISIRLIKPPVSGVIFTGEVGAGITVLPSQIEFVLCLFIVRLSVYWAFRSFEPTSPPAGYGPTHVNGIPIDSMSRDDLMMTVKAMAEALR